MSDSNSIFDLYPKLIALKNVTRDAARTSKNLDEVKEASDLTDRFILGDLLPETFSLTKAGWEVNFADNENGVAHLEYDKGNRQLFATLERDGEKQFTCVNTNSISEVIRYLGLGYPIKWDDSLALRLEGKYNIKYIPQQKESPSICFFPDGYMKAVCLPIPISKLRELQEFHIALNEDQSIRCGCRGYVKLNYSVVNYVEGRNGTQYEDPEWITAASCFLWGIPPIQLPVREQANDGTAAWTTRRIHYLYKANVFLRDLERFLERLYQHGLLGSANDESEKWPNSTEDCAVVLPLGLDVIEGQFQWFNSDRSRRTTYTSFGTVEDQKEIFDRQDEDSDDDVLAAIEAQRHFLSLLNQ